MLRQDVHCVIQPVPANLVSSLFFAIDMKVKGVFQERPINIISVGVRLCGSPPISRLKEPVDSTKRHIHLIVTQSQLHTFSNGCAWYFSFA